MQPPAPPSLLKLCDRLPCSQLGCKQWGTAAAGALRSLPHLTASCSRAPQLPKRVQPSQRGVPCASSKGRGNYLRERYRERGRTASAGHLLLWAELSGAPRACERAADTAHCNGSAVNTWWKRRLSLLQRRENEEGYRVPSELSGSFSEVTAACFLTSELILKR